MIGNTINRARRRYRFLIIGQRAVEDARLSWAARGLLGYLLSRPDDWKVLIKDLQVFFAWSVRIIGRFVSALDDVQEGRQDASVLERCPVSTLYR